jgi:2'-5' RNA ligase
MTFKVADIANEAQLIEIAEKLSDALSTEKAMGQPPDLDVAYIAAAKTLLTAFSEQVERRPSEAGSLEKFLDFDPHFTETAKNMLREFIERVEGRRR